MTKRKIVLVQTKSYDSLIGGDGIYIDGIRKHLRSIGLDVCTLTSNPSKDRPRLIVSLKYGWEGQLARKLRGTIPLLGRYLLVSPIFFKHAFELLVRKIFGERFVNRSPAMTSGEIGWVCREARRFGATHLILCFEAAHSLAFESLLDIKVLHLYGFLNKEQYRINESFDTSATTCQELLGPAAGGARHISAAFSSRDEKHSVKEKFHHIDAIFVGMGMLDRHSSRQPAGDIAVFVGNKTSPNRDSLKYFLQKIWPLVRREQPSARLWVIGRIGHWFSSDLPNGIEMKGEVGDMSEYYWQCKLVVAPLVGGSAGVKTKIAEAISHGRTVVTTSIGVDRFDPGQLDRAGFVEDSPVGFASRILEVFANDTLRMSLEAGSRDVFKSLYSHSASYSELEYWVR